MAKIGLELVHEAAFTTCPAGYLSQDVYHACQLPRYHSGKHKAIITKPAMIVDWNKGNRKWAEGWLKAV